MLRKLLTHPQQAKRNAGKHLPPPLMIQNVLQRPQEEQQLPPRCSIRHRPACCQQRAKLLEQICLQLVCLCLKTATAGNAGLKD